MGLADILDGVGYALDTPGALMRGALGGKLGSRMSSRDLMEQYGMLGENQEGLDWGDVAGFAGDMLLDPLNLVGGLGLAGKAAKAAKANSAIDPAVEAAKAAMRVMPAEAEAATKVGRLFHGTPHTFSKFDEARLDPKALFGRGVYLTDDAQIASEYANKGADALGAAASPQVRMHAADVRNPFNADSMHPMELAATLSNRVVPAAERGEFFRLADSLNKTRGGNLDSIRGHDLYKALTSFTDKNIANEGLRGAGFDAITHEGGHVMGSKPHQVVIPFSPDQVYDTVASMAPQMAQRQALFNARDPIATALGGYNSARAQTAY